MTDQSFERRFASLFEQQFPKLFSYLARLTGDRDLASDLAQETFVRLYRRGAMPETPAAWLVTVANNLLRDHRRAVRRRLALLVHRGRAMRTGAREADPHRELVAEEARVRVRAALDRLGERERELLTLRHSGYSYREIAAVLEVAETGIGTMLARASEVFRRVYEELHGAPD